MNSKNLYFWISLGFFTVLLLLSIWFAEERIVFLDNALQVFLMINDKNIEVMAGRFPATIARVLPYTGVKMQVSIEWIIYLFSVSYVLVQFAFVLAANFLLKDKRWVVATVLSLALVMGNTFFWSNSELSQAIPFSIFAIGLTVQLYGHNGRWLAALIALLASAILAFYHPQSLLVYVFGLLFMLPLKWERRSGYTLPLIGLFVFFTKSHFFKNWYDTLKFEGLVRNFRTLYPDFFQTASWSEFFGWLPNQLLLVFGVFLVTVAILMMKRKWYKCLLLVVGSFLNIMVFHIANTGAMTAYYAEAGYLVWSGMVALAFTFEVLELTRYKHSVFLLLLVWCLLKIAVVSNFYVERLAYVKALADTHLGEKVIIDRRTLPQDLFMLDWGLPFETYIASTLKNKQNPSVVVSASNAEQYRDYIKGDLFINGMGSVVKSKIDSSYFEWTDEEYELRY